MKVYSVVTSSQEYNVEVEADQYTIDGDWVHFFIQPGIGPVFSIHRENLLFVKKIGEIESEETSSSSETEE